MSSRPSQRDRQQQTTEYSLNRPNTFTKLDLKPRRYHYYNVVLFIFGTLFPPLAVAARFGIGGDFWLNMFLTICGYIPGHGHNFYIQNIRNNKNHRRTPKWAIRYGLVDDSEIRRKERKSQWAGRYNDRLPNSVLEGQQVEEGQVPDHSRDPSTTNVNGVGGGAASAEGRLWDSREDERFYGQRTAQGSGSVSTGGSGGGSGGRWHYPANFDDAEPESPTAGMEIEQGKGKKGKGRGLLGGKKKKDRWALSEDARRGAKVPDGEFVGVNEAAKKKKSKRRKKVGEVEDETYTRPRAGSTSRSEIEEPEDAVGGLYGDRPGAAAAAAAHVDPTEQREAADKDLFGHQF